MRFPGLIDLVLEIENLDLDKCELEFSGAEIDGLGLDGTEGEMVKLYFNYIYSYQSLDGRGDPYYNVEVIVKNGNYEVGFSQGM